MLRSKPATSMQKTYDEAFLSASTAVYFEGQNNEAEALRSWRSGLDAIYFHNAYRVPANYIPKSETERALQESLRTLELQCKERVDLLEALSKSRAEENAVSEKENSGSGRNGTSVDDRAKNVENATASAAAAGQQRSGLLGDGTVNPVSYSELPKPPPLPQRPSYTSNRKDSYGILPTRKKVPESAPAASNSSSTLSPPPTLPVPKTQPRQASPDPKRVSLMTTLRSRQKKSSTAKSKDSKQERPAASKAAGLAWGVPASTGASSAAAKSLANESSRSAASTPVPQPASNVMSQTEPGTSDSSLSSITARTSAERLSGTDVNSPKTDRPPVALSYRNEYPKQAPPLHIARAAPAKIREERPTPLSDSARRFSWENDSSSHSQEDRGRKKRSNGVDAKAAPKSQPRRSGNTDAAASSASKDARRPRTKPSVPEPESRRARPRRRRASSADSSTSSISSAGSEAISVSHLSDWELKVQGLIANPPRGVTTLAAKQIFNEIIVQGDEVHWDDVAGLDIAKKALKEAVVYPFLRPDLFMGLREPARGMLLFGPPGTGKTMLARAVATESKSTFFAISASSLASKWHGESEQLVRALFGLAKALAPSIIFVDEIDSILSARSSSNESETDRRTKTEFLIQWSDLQRAAAGRDTNKDKNKEQGDPSRVLVLAATNMPWDIDEAARRRFVRRQYIPLPEDEVRELQLRNLLSHQKHDLTPADIEVLVKVTEGFSGSDITALAKDAAMGPLRSLGEALLHMSKDQIRPISFQDFEDSLINIRPSVGKEGLLEYEKWAREFGERGG